MLYTLCLAVLLPCALAGPYVIDMNQALHLQTDVDKGMPMEHVFKAFKHLHNKQYATEYDEILRKKIFEDNVYYMKEHNKQYAMGKKSYSLGINQFFDLTHKEFLDFYAGHVKGERVSNGSTYLSPYQVLVPDQVDWREKGYVTPVKNQGQCGSCWSFSTTGSVEGQHFRKTGKLLSLSEQQLVDCSGSYGNQGCDGGLMDNAFEYIESIKGLETEEDYPYEAVQEDKCSAVREKEVASVTGYVDVPSGKEDKLKEAVGTVGPVSVAIDASHRSFQMYNSGVYDEEECSSTELDHGVLVVGYGTEGGADYWLVKNSWGTVWGMEGYIRMARNKDNLCGVATQASYPLV